MMQAIEAVALNKFKLNGERDRVLPGKYDIDAIIRVNGTVRIGEDYDQRVVAKADPWSLLAVALNKLNNVTLDSIVREAEEVDGSDIKTSVDKAIEQIKKPTKTKAKGKVTAVLTFESVEPVVAEQTAIETALWPTRQLNKALGI
jgi:hypothetical protein